MSGPAPRPFPCPKCQTLSKIRTSTQRPSMGGRVRYRACEACDLYFATLQRAGSDIEEIIPEKQRPARVRSHTDILDRQNWNCEDCEFRAHCDSAVATRAALPCEKYMFLDENPDLLVPRNLPYDQGSIQMDGTYTIALI